MGFRLNRRIRLGPGLRLNLGTKGVSLSVGRRGAWYTVHSSGRTTQTVGLPGTGISYRTQSRLPGTKTRRAPRTTVAMEIAPRAGLFSPKDVKAFVRGVGLYQRRDWAGALAAFQESMAHDPDQTHTSEEFFAALCHIAVGRREDAIALLRAVLASKTPLPDALMRDHGVEGAATISVTPNVTVTVPAGHLAAALLLAELLQSAGRAPDAAALLESLGSLSGDALFALSLADLYAGLEKPKDVLRVTEDFTTNTDDARAQILVYRARALRELKLVDAAHEVLKEALKSKSRARAIILDARYERALTYEGAGQAAKARKDLERIYAEDPKYADVAKRLGL